MPMDSGIEPDASSPVSFVGLSINRPAGQEPNKGFTVRGSQFPVRSWLSAHPLVQRPGESI